MKDEKLDNQKMLEPVKSLKNVLYFLGFANFYRGFIQDYSTIILPITKNTSLEKHEW